MDIDALKTFLEVYRCRHFGQAAKNLYVSQSTVSARIKLLEDRVGLPVFVRKRNDIQLTAAGERLLKYAETIVTTWSRARQDIGIEQEDRIPFVVGAMPSLWDTVLNPWMGDVLQRVPKLVINAEVHSQEFLSRRLLEGTMDIAFVFDSQQQGKLECRELMALPLILVSSDAKADVEDIFEQNYILVEWGHDFAVAHARYFPEIPVPRLHVMLGRIALDYILAHGGAAYLAEPMVEDLLNQGVLHRVMQAPVIKRQVYALYAHDSQRKGLIEQALEYFSYPRILEPTNIVKI